MTIKLKKSSLKRLASLSALGAGALGFNAGTAEAYVVYSGTINEKVGFGPGYGTHASIALPHGAALALFTFRSTAALTSGNLTHLDIAARNLGGPDGTRASFRVARSNNFFCLGAPRGAKFGTPPAVRGSGYIATSEGGSQRLIHTYTKFNSTDQYLLFRFTGGKLPHSIYGWAQLSLILPHDLAGPQMTLVSWAYEESGAQLAAGVHRQAMDESDDISAIAPSAFDASGLRALSLGAVGVRNWRVAREAEAAIIRRKPSAQPI